MTEEDEEFQRIEREAEMRRMAEEDDDTQVYKKAWVGLTDEEREAIANSTIRIHGQEWAYATAIEAKLREKNS